MLPFLKPGFIQIFRGGGGGGGGGGAVGVSAGEVAAAAEADSVGGFGGIGAADGFGGYGGPGEGGGGLAARDYAELTGGTTTPPATAVPPATQQPPAQQQPPAEQPPDPTQPPPAVAVPPTEMVPPEVVYVPTVSPLSAAQYMSMLPSSAQQYAPAAGAGNASPAVGLMPPNLAPLLMPGANGQPLTFEQYLAQLPMPVVAPLPSDLLQGIGSLPMTDQS